MRSPLRLLAYVVIATVLSSVAANGQDTVKKTAAKSAVAATKQVSSAIPINPKTGRPYSKWGYGANAKAYQAQKTADSLNKVGAAKPIAVAPATAVAATPDTPIAADKSLSGQYQYLLTKVYNYQQPFVAAFWKNVRDSLNNNRKQLKEVNDKLAASNQSISQLQTNVTAHETELSEADSVDFIGISFSKNGYSAMMWGLVLILGAVAAFVILRSGSARSEAAYRTKLYSELEEEYKAFKVKANEKEKKLARELQTERNKVDELMGRA